MHGSSQRGKVCARPEPAGPGVVELDVRFVIQPPASTALDKLRGLWDLVDVVTENNLIRAIVTWMSPMPFPFAEIVALTDLQRAQLESLVRAGSTPQALVFRCRLILRAADRDHPSNLQIAAEFDCNRHTVAGWRRPLPLKRIGWPPGRAAVGTTATIFPLGEARSDQFGEQHNRTARLSRHPTPLTNLGGLCLELLSGKGLESAFLEEIGLKHETVLCHHGEVLPQTPMDTRTVPWLHRLRLPPRGHLPNRHNGEPSVLSRSLARCVSFSPLKSGNKSNTPPASTVAGTGFAGHCNPSS